MAEIRDREPAEDLRRLRRRAETRPSRSTDGEFFCLLGPSGCGKTTTLRMIAGLELPTVRADLLGGEDVTFKRASRARHRLRVPALRALSAHECAREHRLSAELRGRAAAPRSGSASRRRPHPAHRPSARPVRSRACRAATASASRSAAPSCAGRKAFLMDEPLGALDAEFRHIMCGELRALHDRLGATTVYVTHDQLEAMAMADKIAVMNNGVVEQFAPPQEIYDRPASMFVADFIGSPPMNFLRLRGAARAAATNHRCSMEVRGRRSRASRGRCRGRARRSACGPSMSASTTPRRCAAQVFGTEYLGTTQIVTVDDGTRQREGARAVRHHACARASTVGLELPSRTSCRSSMRPSGRALPHGAARRRPRMAEVALDAVSKRFGDIEAVAGSLADHRRRRVRRAARADRRRQDDDAAPRRRAGSGRTPARSVIGGRDVTRRAAGLARRRLRVPAIFALSASLRLRQPRLPAALAGPPNAGAASRSARYGRSHACCASRTSCDNRATQLSGGQMQRVAIGRALVRSPAIYLMDEPLSSLDAKLRADLRLELKRIQADLGATILYVTHDQIEAMTLAARIGVIDQGRLVQVGTPRQIYEEPVDMPMSRPGSAARHQPAAARRCFPDASAPPAAARRSARARSILRISQGREWRVPSARSPGSSISATRTTCMSRSRTDDLVTLADPDRGLEVGDAVAVEFVRPALLRRCRQPGRTVMRSIDMRHDGPESAARADRGGRRRRSSRMPRS